MIKSQARHRHDAIHRRDRAFLHQAGEKRLMLVVGLPGAPGDDFFVRPDRPAPAR